MPKNKICRYLRTLSGTKKTVILTVLYLSFFAGFGIARWPELLNLELNEVGDLLAGIFAPLAFLWLILGFFQQQKELRLNTEALRIQSQELRQSVEQHRLLVKESTEQTIINSQLLAIEEDRRSGESSPQIRVCDATIDETPDLLTVVFQNPTTIPFSCDWKASSPQLQHEIGRGKIKQLHRRLEHKVQFKIDSDDTGSSPTKIYLEFTYLDSQSTEQKEEFVIDLEKSPPAFKRHQQPQIRSSFIRTKNR